MLASAISSFTHRAHTELTLQEAIRQARAGSADALAELYRLYAVGLFELARQLTGSTQDAEDVVHDVFVGLPDALRHYSEQGLFDAWLKRVLVRTALMGIRRSRRRAEEELDASGELPDGAIRPDMLQGRELWAAVAALPDSLRVTVVLRHVGDHTHEEVARLLGISAGAVRVRYARALRLLRDALGEDE